jgi:hypothetical protein
MKYSEQIAKTVIEMLCVGSEMRFRRDQSTSVPDFDLRYLRQRLGHNPKIVAAIALPAIGC